MFILIIFSFSAWIIGLALCDYLEDKCQKILKKYPDINQVLLWIGCTLVLIAVYVAFVVGMIDAVQRGV